MPPRPEMCDTSDRRLSRWCRAEREGRRLTRHEEHWGYARNGVPHDAVCHRVPLSIGARPPLKSRERRYPVTPGQVLLVLLNNAESCGRYRGRCANFSGKSTPVAQVGLLESRSICLLVMSDYRSSGSRDSFGHRPGRAFGNFATQESHSENVTWALLAFAISEFARENIRELRMGCESDFASDAQLFLRVSV